MKRADLYRSRGMKMREVTGSRPQRRAEPENPGALYPFCHLLQLIVVIVAVLILMGNHLILSETSSAGLQTWIQTELTQSVEIPEGEWSGSLKDIFFTENQDK